VNAQDTDTYITKGVDFFNANANMQLLNIRKMVTQVTAKNVGALNFIQLLHVNAVHYGISMIQLLILKKKERRKTSQ